METGAQDWAFSCGQCHAGGGQLEYDRDRNPYSASSGSGDYYYYKPPTLDAPAGGIVAGNMSDTNKAEVDCLLCHLNDNSGISGNGRAFLNSMDCATGGTTIFGTPIQLGPNNDPNCSYPLASNGTDPALTDPSMMGRNGAGMYVPGTKYDSFNRTLAIQDKNYALAASLGIGAKANLSMAADGHLHINGLTGVPTTIAAANIQSTPNSQNCTVCHGRDDNTPGLPGMLNPVRYGYGIYLIVNPKGTVLDVDPGSTQQAALGDPTPGANAVRWMEMGCKTGMGKRGHKTGAGPNDKWGMSMFSAMFGLGIGPGTPITTTSYSTPLGPLVTKAKMPDQDVHDKAGFQCATCHFGLGSTSLQSGSVTIPAKTDHGVAYPSETILGIDHNFAQGDSLKDNYGRNHLDDTVSCESCHITQDNPRIAAGQITPPVPTHSGLPQVHLDKIGCTTCHIPEIYIQPFKLKYRDFTVGKFKRGTETAGGNKNIYDFSFNFVTGSGDSVKQLHQWAHKYGETKIYPVTPIEVANWISVINNWNLSFGSAATSTHTVGTSAPDPANNNTTTIFNLSTEPNAIKTCQLGVKVLWTCNTDADCPGYLSFPDPNMGAAGIPGACQPGNAANVTPAMQRDIIDVTAAAIADGSLKGVRVNGGAMAPVFDNWVLTDNLSMDTIAKRDAMRTKSAAMFPGDPSKQLALEKIFHAAFDETHGVAPKEWALGATERGGCAMCHSSANPMSPNFSPYSVGFFEGLQPYTERATQFQPAPNAPLPDQLVPAIGAMFVGKFDLMKNPVALFADFDCTREFCGAGTCGGTACSTQNIYGVAGLDMLGSMLVNMGAMDTSTALAYGFALTPDSYYFNQMTGAVNDVGAPCSSNSVLWDLGGMNPAYSGMGIRTIGQCTALMNAGFDAMMGLPHSVDGAGNVASTAGMMGFSDGIAGLQGLFLRETQDGTSMGCNPMPGPFHQAMNIGSVDVSGNAVDVNNCMPHASFAPMTPVGQLPVGMLFAGTCTGAPSADGMWPATCQDGFRNGQGCLPDVNLMCTAAGAPMPCCTGPYTGVCPNAPVPAGDHIPAANRNGMCMAAGNPFSCCTGPGAGTCLAIEDSDIDCIGSLPESEAMFQFSRDPFGSLGSLMFPRDQQRAHNKVNLQSNGPLDLTWPIFAEKNPDNPDHKAGWDQAARCLTNYGFMGPDVPCGMTGTGYCVGQDGTSADKCVNVKTYVSANDLLGFSSTKFAALQNMNNCAACHAAPTHMMGTGNPYPNCTTCHTTHDNGASIPTINVCQTCHGAKYTDVQLTNIAAGIHLPPKTITVTQTANGSISPYTYTGFLTGMNSTYQIQPNAGFHVADVVVDGVSVGAVTSYTFNNIQADHTITATYAANLTYTITATVTGSGSISPAGVTSLMGGMSQNYVITPAAGYRIDKVLVDGVNKGAITSYTFTNVNADHTIAANFVSDTYTIAASVLSGSGSISPAGATTLNGGGSQTYSFAPATGYKVSYVTVNGAAVRLAADGTYTFSNVRANYTIGVSFVPLTYTITVTQTPNGSISPYTYTGFTSGMNQKYSIKPSAGYHVVDVIVDGSSVGVVSSYTFTNIQADHGITATFAENPSATITATAGANGSISPSGSVTVLSGTNKNYSFTPDSDYRINQVFVDGVSKGTLSGYTFVNITAGDHTISVTFNPTITASAGTGGTISPAGTSTVSSGSSKTYTIKANAGYHIADVVVDGISAGAAGTYTFTNVTTPHTISVTFALN